MTGVPKRISRRWLDQQQTRLDCTSKADPKTKEPNPNYAKLADEISEAAAELARWEDFAGWVKATLGMSLNQYSLRTSTVTYDPDQVFFRKDKETGKTTFLTRQQAWDKYESSKGV